MSESNFNNHIYIAGRCVFCNINYLDEDSSNPEHNCVERNEGFSYTTSSSEERSKVYSKGLYITDLEDYTDPAYYDFLHQQNPHLTIEEIKERFSDTGFSSY